MEQFRLETPRHLPFFVAGLPDETIASRVSRYHLLRGHSKARDTFGELFESAPFNLGHWVPPKLEVLATKLPGIPEINLGNLHSESTLLTLFRIFGATSQQRQNSHDSAANERMPRRIVGETGSTHVCLSCAADDVQSEGIPYIHRAHQIPGVTACWRHGTRTVDRCPVCNCPLESPNRLILSPWAACACGRSLEDMQSHELQADPIEVDYAKFTYSMLSWSGSHFRLDRVVAAYRERVIELGYGKGETRIDRKALMAAITSSYGEDLLYKMDYALRADRGDGWLRLLNVASVVDVPLSRHLLLSFFLFGDAKAFFSAVENAKPIPRRDASNFTKWSPRKPGNGKSNQSEPVGMDGGIEELAQLAVKQGRGVDGLWITRHGTMRRLVSKNPDAVSLLQRRIDQLTHIGCGNGLGFPVKNNQPAGDPDVDEQWAKEVDEASVLLYSKGDKPIKITMNQLIKVAQFKQPCWPSMANFPKTRQMLEACSESLWHFYARRIVWALLHFPPHMYRGATLLKKAGLECHKGGVVLQHLEPLVQRRLLKPGTIIATLEKLGIGKHWEGPCPDRKFATAGRHYTPRKKPGLK